MADPQLPAIPGLDGTLPTLTDEQRSLMLLWQSLAERPLSELPGHDLRALPDLIDVARRRMDPAGTILAGRLIAFVAETLQVQAPGSRGLQGYLRVLAEVPPDLLKLATERILKTHRYKTLPTPAEWLAQVDDELTERRRDRAQLEGLLRRAAVARKLYPAPPAEPRPPATEESKARVKRLVDEALRKLGQPRN